MSTSFNRFMDKPDLGKLLGAKAVGLDVMLAQLDMQGFPKRDPAVNLWWGPAVKAFFDRRSGLLETTAMTAASSVDGEENWA